jgi:hypothetical protein
VCSSTTRRRSATRFVKTSTKFTTDLLQLRVGGCGARGAAPTRTTLRSKLRDRSCRRHQCRPVSYMGIRPQRGQDA